MTGNLTQIRCITGNPGPALCYFPRPMKRGITQAVGRNPVPSRRHPVKRFQLGSASARTTTCFSTPQRYQPTVIQLLEDRGPAQR